jgi:hypothetical protein
VSVLDRQAVERRNRLNALGQRDSVGVAHLCGLAVVDLHLTCGRQVSSRVNNRMINDAERLTVFSVAGRVFQTSAASLLWRAILVSPWKTSTRRLGSSRTARRKTKNGDSGLAGALKSFCSPSRTATSQQPCSLINQKRKAARRTRFLADDVPFLRCLARCSFSCWMSSGVSKRCHARSSAA